MSGFQALVFILRTTWEPYFKWFLASTPSAGLIQFSRSVMSNSLRPHELQHARPPCPSPTPRVHSNSRPSIRCPKINILNKPRRQFVYKWFLQTEELVKASSFSVILLPIHRRPRAYSSLFWLPWRPPILAGMCRPT